MIHLECVGISDKGRCPKREGTKSRGMKKKGIKVRNARYTNLVVYGLRHSQRPLTPAIPLSPVNDD